MRKLHTLGRIELVGSDGSRFDALLSQAKLSALLVSMTSPAPGRLHRRDTLLALLWPDLGPRRARHALRQALTRIRSVVGSDVVVTSGDAVGICPEALWSDTAAFREALEADRLGEALRLYEGEFLPGFYLSGAPAFERWVDGERARLTEAAREAARALSQQAEGGADLGEAVRWARRETEVAPWREDAWRRLVGLLYRTGGRAAALRAYAACDRQLRGELGIAPSAATQALVAEIQTDGGEARTGRSSPAGIESVAVLPFSDLSPEPLPDYFVEGVTDLLTSQLARLRGTDVISRSSATKAAADAPGDLEGIAGILGVDAVVEGFLVRSGSRLRITAQLTALDPQRHVLAHSFEGCVGDLLEIQGELARAVASGVEGSLDPSLQPGPTAVRIDPAAQDAYFRGLYLWNRWTERGFRAALSEFERAVQLDPGFALAHTGVAHVCSTMGYFGSMRPSEAMPRSFQAAGRALELDPSLGEAHVALGMYRFLWEWDVDAAEAEIRRALERAPGSATAHWVRSLILSATGRFDAAIAEIRRARRLDPLSLPVRVAEGWARLAARDLEGASTVAREVLDLEPAFGPGRWLAGVVLLEQGRPLEARDELREACRLTDRAPFVAATLASAEARANGVDRARSILDELIGRAKTIWVPPVALAMGHVALGEVKEAVACLADAVEQRDGWALYLDAWPRLDAVRDDPGFRRIRDHLPTVG